MVAQLQKLSKSRVSAARYTTHDKYEYEQCILMFINKLVNNENISSKTITFFQKLEKEK